VFPSCPNSTSDVNHMELMFAQMFGGSVDATHKENMFAQVFERKCDDCKQWKGFAYRLDTGQAVRTSASKLMKNAAY
jgi:hypothetical protein